MTNSLFNGLHRKTASFNYRGEKLVLKMSERYNANKQMVIEAFCKDGEPYAMVSKCLSTKKLAPDCTYIDSNNLPGVVDSLVKQGIVEITGESAQGGFCTYPLVRVLP